MPKFCTDFYFTGCVSVTTAQVGMGEGISVYVFEESKVCRVGGNLIYRKIKRPFVVPGRNIAGEVVLDSLNTNGWEQLEQCRLIPWGFCFVCMSEKDGSEVS